MLKKIIFMIIALVFCQNHFLFAANNTPNDIYLPYSWDCTYYFRTRGAPNGCGAEAWMTLTGKGDSIYAAKGTKQQFITMKFSVEDALKMNRQLAGDQQLKIKNKFIMVEFTKHRIQALAGYINKDVFGLILLLPEKKGLVKLEGSRESLEKLGFAVTTISNTNLKKKIQILQNIQSKTWGIINMNKSGHVNIRMKKKGQSRIESVSIEKFINR